MPRENKKFMTFGEFKDLAFKHLEDQAQEGKLDYYDFPPVEYKYFSRLSRLYASGRRNGYSDEKLKKAKQQLQADYIAEKEREESVMKFFSEQTQLRIKHSEAMYALETATTEHDKLEAALTALEAILGEKGLKERIMRK